MNTPRQRLWIGLLCLTIVVLLGAAPSQAAPHPQGGRWLPFAPASTPSLPTLTLLAADATQVRLAADLPGCTAEDIAVGGRTFTRLSGEGYGHPAAIGWPDLPVLRRDVEIPFAAEVSLEIVATTYRETTLGEVGLQAIYPLQPPVRKEDGAENRPLTIDRAAYQAGRTSDAPVHLGEVYTVRGHRVQPVEVWPLAYDPSSGALRLYSQVTFRLRLSGSDLARTASLAARYASPAFEPVLSRQILNYNQGRPAVTFAPDTPVGYLIITADAYYDAMLPFVSLREDRGYDVTMVRCSEIGGCMSPTAVRAYIKTAYDTWPIPPSYLLLVGDTDTLATWTGPVIDTSTDLYYGCMDGDVDWHPDIGRGRFPVRSPAQTTILVNKYLAYAGLTGLEPWVKKDAFVATCDLYQVAEGTHNYVIDTYTLPRGYSGTFPNNPQPGGDKLYCITYGATKADMSNSFDDGRLMIIYSGHGNHSGWEMEYGPDDVRALAENGVSAFVASHACLTADFGAMDEVYGETWVLQPNKGALVYWGSTTFSYWDEDDVLERAMFDSYFAPVLPHPSVAQMTDYGLSGVEAAYPYSARYYRETYNVLGDPAVRIFIDRELPSFDLHLSPDEHEVCKSGTVTSSLRIASLMGYSRTVYLETGPLPAGVTATLSPAWAPVPYTATLTLDVSPSAPAGDYTIAVTASDYVSWTRNVSLRLLVRPGPPGSVVLLSPPDGAGGQPLWPTMTWQELPYAGSYSLQVDYGPFFTAPLIDVAGLAGTSYATPEALAGGRCHWWRVQGENACDAGAWAEPFHFATAALGYAFYDDVERGNQGWTAQPPWAITDEQSHSAGHSWTDSPGGEYQDEVDVALTSRVLDLSAYDSVALGFWHTYQTEPDFDDCYVEYSIDGGNSWTTQRSYSGSAAWTYEEFDVPALAHQPRVRIRFRLQSDISVTLDGWHVDDIRIIVPLAPTPAPLVTDVVPAYGTPLEPTLVQIAGSGFLDGASARLGTTWLLSLTLVSSTTLDAVVPAGMAPGTYDLTLYNGDCQQALLEDAFSIITACLTPTVELAAGSPVELGQSMYFTATATGAPPPTYTWDMGGPGYGSGLDSATPLFTYTIYGSFSVTVNVANACGAAQDSTVVEVLCDAPAAGFASDSPVTLGEAMHFTSTVAGTGPISYTWDLGDGVGTSHEADPVYTYTAPGEFTVTLVVQAPCGTSTATDWVTVLDVCQSPQAGFSSTAPVFLGQPMHFTSTVSGSGPFTYTWDFGDGVGGSSEAHPTYVYTATGTFTVTLAVQGQCGEDTATAAVTVLPAAERYVRFLPIVFRNQ